MMPIQATWMGNHLFTDLYILLLGVISGALLFIRDDFIVLEKNTALRVGVWLLQ